MASARASAASPTIASLRRDFRRPPAGARPMMRWWWFGPAVTRAGLEREMRRMRAGGIGGFEVQPVYPLDLDDDAAGVRNLRYLSDEFLAMVRFTARKARTLGLRFDLTLGSGWPYGGPQIPIGLAASQLRRERVPVVNGARRVPLPAIATGEQLVAAFPGGGGRELTDIHDGALWLPEGAKHPGEIWFFVHGRTGQMVKRAAVGAEGYVSDHYDRAATDRYLAGVGTPLLRACGDARPHAIFCDSLEVYGADWTGNFLAEFRRRRGYDLRPHLPVFAEGLEPAARALRCDWGCTLTELLEENFLQPLRDWSRARGTKFRLQCYGTPPATVSSNAFADLNEGEGTPWKRVSACRLASSGAHLLGRTVVSSETWTWLHSPSFRAAPLDLKAEADLHFLQGINQLIGHGWPYSPDAAGYPGWRFYAAGVFNDRNPWWIVMPEVMGYMHRLSHLLRQGRPANDIAFYLSNSDGWSAMTPGDVDMWRTQMRLVGRELVGRVVEAGYGLDFCDDRLLARATLEDGALLMGGNRYRVVLLPGIEAMPVATARLLANFVRRGGILVATRRLPEIAPGFLATEAEKTEVRETMRRLFAPGGGRTRFAAEDAAVGAALRAELTPDVALHAANAAADFGFIRRTTPDAEIYFLANTGNQPLAAEATFRVSGRTPEWWNPVTAETRAAAILRRDGATTTLALALAPYESQVVVFPRKESSAPRLRRPAAPAVATAKPIDLSTGWLVTCGKSGPRLRLAELRSWTDDERLRYFSGVATYEKSFTVPRTWRGDGARVVLDFGLGRATEPEQRSSMTHGMAACLDAPVREAAVVSLNGRRAGAVWCSPYLLDVTRQLRAGRNTLRIAVANLALNHMAGHALPDYRLLNLRYGERFQAQDMERVVPMPSGLFGPVRLVQHAE